MTTTRGRGTVVTQQELHRGSSDKTLQPCGTPAAARRHHKRGEELDPACREAFRRYHREYRQQARRVEAFRRRERAAGIRWEQRIKADPTRLTQLRQRREERERTEQLASRNIIDPVVVDRLAAGITVPHNRAERLQAVRRLHAQGRSYNAIAARLHVTQRQVHRDLTDLGLIPHHDREATG